MATRIKTSLPTTEFVVADGNFDKTRKPIDRIIIHTTVSSAQSAISHFGDPLSKVSAHYIIGLDGTIYHGLEEYWTAYHAGNYDMNQRSLGLEHEDGGKPSDPRPDFLYEGSAKLVADICMFYNIPVDNAHIIPHRNIVNTQCPDALDVDRIINTAQKLVKTPQNAPSEVTDQTKLDLSACGQEYKDHGPYEWQQIQAMIIAKDAEIQHLSDVVAKASQNTPSESTAPSTLNTPVTTSIGQVILGWIKKLLGKLWK